MSAPILKYGTKWSVRILRPQEYSLLRERGFESDSVRFQLDALLYTGMRYVEAQRFLEHPEWLTPPFVSLPPSATLKGKRRQLQRWIKLNQPGLDAVRVFLKGKRLPGWETWTLHLREAASKAGMDPGGLSPKTTRKTWESWLVFMYPERMSQILLNQGHTGITSVGHYLNMPFLPADKEAMRPYVEGVF